MCVGGRIKIRHIHRYVCTDADTGNRHSDLPGTAPKSEGQTQISPPPLPHTSMSLSFSAPTKNSRPCSNPSSGWCMFGASAHASAQCTRAREKKIEQQLVSQEIGQQRPLSQLICNQCRLVSSAGIVSRYLQRLKVGVNVDTAKTLDDFETDNVGELGICVGLQHQRRISKLPCHFIVCPNHSLPLRMKCAP